MDGVDERPLAVRRKRRESTSLVDPVAQKATSQPLNGDTTTHVTAGDPPKTPGNRKKRIRFSEPLEVVASSSTGLTPALNRTKLVPAKPTETAHKRRSLSTQFMTSTTSPPSLQVSSMSSSRVIQFTPLRQAIGTRMMRRLKRNHLSDEINHIYAERRKSKVDLQQEVEDLRKELAIVKENGDPGTEGACTTPENAERIAELENELVHLKQEMREQSAIVEDTRSQQASEDGILMDAGSPDQIGGSSEQPVVLEQNDTAVNNVGPVRSPVSVVEASTQVDLPSPTLSDICRSARLSLEYLFPGETALGLEVSDPQPLVEAIISRAEKLKAEMARAEQKIAVSETSTANMGKHLNTALAELERVNRQIKVLKEEYEQEKERASHFELEVSTFEARLDNARDKYSAVEKQRDEHQRSIDRICPALDQYREECEHLTRTIMDLENSHEIALKNLRTELAEDNDAALACQQLVFEEAKSDLEAQAAAETTGRRKAEESAVERLGRIKELENRQKELQSAVHQKQSIIRDLESELESSKSSQEKEVGQLNVRIGKLVSDLSSANTELAAVRGEATRLADLVEQEKVAGLKAVESMQFEVKKCSNNVDTVKDKHAEGVKKRGEQVAQSFGLMTPVVEGGKFRDAESDEKVEGHVQFVRGRKRETRPDSGVEIWGMIAEEDEEGVDGDALMEG